MNDDNSLEKAFGKTLVYYNKNLYIYGASLINNDENSTSTMDIFNLDTEKWDKIQFSANYPNARIGHLAYVYNNKMYIFFGNNIENSSIYNDVWSHNFISSTWSNLSNFPHQDLCASIQIDTKVYLLFGRVGFQGVNSISHFDLSNTVLENNLIIENNFFPPKRRNHCMIKFNDKIYIFGGISEDGSYLNDLWKFYSTSQIWELVIPSGTIPSGRSSFGCNIDEGTGFLIYGGNSTNGVLGDFYYHDFVANSWEEIKSTSLGPGQRAGLCLCSIPLFSFIIGGSLGSETYKDIWLYDYTNSEYIKVAELPVGLINAKCWNELVNGIHNIYVISGTTIHFDANTYVFNVTIYQKNGVYINSVEKIKNDTIIISESALILSDDTAILVLGSAWNNFLNQPKPFHGKTKMISTTVEVLWIYSTILFLICIFAIFKIAILWNNVEKIDLFVSYHEQNINVPVIYRKTKLGGFFSIIYIVVASIIIIGSFMAYELDNIIKIKGLVPLITVEESISAQNFIVEALFLTYGGLCQKELDNVKLISIIETNIDYIDRDIKLQNKSGDFLISLIYNDITFSDSAKITIKFNELTARSTSIYVNVSTSSSIPSEPSNISVILFPPDFKQVFIGLQPSIIPLSLIPSVIVI